MPAKIRLRTIHGQPSWRLANADTEAYITRLGGHVAPVTFDRKHQKITPFSIAPWATEPLPKSTPNVIRALRGDFFCCPFGGNASPYKKEQHPVHGQSANANWTFHSLTKTPTSTTLHLTLPTTIRKGKIDKQISLINGHPALYSRHILTGMSGPMPLGHHAMLKFPTTGGIITTSPFRFGQVYPNTFEDPALGGYTSLQPGAPFTSLTHVPTPTGHTADLTHYPARRGFEDLVMIVSDPTLPFAWTAVTFPANDSRPGYVWFALKDPRVLTSTVFWISNAGRHYAPWSGRHASVMGLEEVTAYFHDGLAESAAPNPLSTQGLPTALTLNPKIPLTINYIMACLPVPKNFDAVAAIQHAPHANAITLHSHTNETLTVPIDLEFLQLPHATS